MATKVKPTRLNISGTIQQGQVPIYVNDDCFGVGTIPTDNCQLANGCGYTTCTGNVTTSDLACYAQCCDIPDMSGYQQVCNMVCDLTGADNSHYPSAKAVADALSCAGAGDMLKSTYDPNNHNADAFDYCNFTNTPTIPTDNCQLANSCGYTTCTGTVSTCADIISKLGYTPYNSTNPNGYTTCTGTVVAGDLAPYAKSCDLCAIATSGLYCDISGRVTDNCQIGNGCGYTTCTGTLVPSNIACINGCCLTNGGNVCLDGLPSQTGCCGKFLSTNGTSASWEDVPAGGIQNDTTGTTDTIDCFWSGTKAEFELLTPDPDNYYIVTDAGTPQCAVCDAVFSCAWDGVTDKAPSMNAVYDVLGDVETLLANL